MALTYPVDIHPSLVVTGNTGVQTPSPEEPTTPATPVTVTVNCTVAFLTQRMSKHKCESNCATMGATAMRWFEDGCCQCVGHHCQNYGVRESRCDRFGANEETLVDDLEGSR